MKSFRAGLLGKMRPSSLLGTLLEDQEDLEDREDLEDL